MLQFLVVGMGNHVREDVPPVLDDRPQAAGWGLAQSAGQPFTTRLSSDLGSACLGAVGSIVLAGLPLLPLASTSEAARHSHGITCAKHWLGGAADSLGC